MVASLGYRTRFLRGARQLTAARLRGAGAVVFLNTSGELHLDAAGRRRLLAYVRDGGAFVGAHAAARHLPGLARLSPHARRRLPRSRARARRPAHAHRRRRPRVHRRCGRSRSATSSIASGPAPSAMSWCASTAAARSRGGGATGAGACSTTRWATSRPRGASPTSAGSWPTGSAGRSAAVRDRTSAGTFAAVAALWLTCPCVDSCPSPPSRSRSSPPRPAARRPGRGRDRRASRPSPATAAGRRGRATTAHRPLHAHGARRRASRRRQIGMRRSSRPFDASMGPDAHRTSPRLPALRLARLRHPALQRRHGHRAGPQTVSSPSYSEATPAIWGAERRLHPARPRLRRPVRQEPELLAAEPPAAQEQVPADRPGPRLDPRQSDRHQLGRHERGRLQRRRPQGRRAAQVLEQRGGSQVIVKQSFGEESNFFGQVAQDDRFAYTVRVGIHQANTFMRSPSPAASPRRCAPSARSPTRSPSRGQLLALRRVPGRRGDLVRRLHRRPVPPRARARASRSAACSAR